MTDISEMKFIYGRLYLLFENEGGDQDEDEGKCYFMKYENTPLLLVCWVVSGKNFGLKKLQMK